MHRTWSRSSQILASQILASQILASLILMSLPWLAAGCADGPTAGDYIGQWAYESGTLSMDCGDGPQESPLSGPLELSEGQHADVASDFVAECLLGYNLHQGRLEPAGPELACVGSGYTLQITDTSSFSLDEGRQVLSQEGSLELVTSYEDGSSDTCTYTVTGVLRRS